MPRIDFSQGRQFAPGVDVELYATEPSIRFRGTETGQFVSPGSIIEIIDNIVRAETASWPKFEIKDPFLKDGIHFLGNILGVQVALKTINVGGMKARVQRTKFAQTGKKSADMRIQQRFEQVFKDTILPSIAAKVEGAMRKVVEEKIYNNRVTEFVGWDGFRIPGYGPQEEDKTLLEAVKAAVSDEALPTIEFGFDADFLSKALEPRSNVTPYWVYLEWGHRIFTPGHGKTKETMYSGKWFPARPFYDEMIRAGKETLEAALKALPWAGINEKVGAVIMEYIRGGATASSYA